MQLCTPAYPFRVLLPNKRRCLVDLIIKTEISVSKVELVDFDGTMNDLAFRVVELYLVTHSTFSSMALVIKKSTDSTIIASV